ncbi:MAG TPA: DNA mismatch repair endonuclease MutL, partial [Terracidiphilus sp.]|nr:DNA mismatch repair endonuclease MutL [Terracidiphilus sp.]
MGRIHVLPEHVANKIAAGEVVERPASVVKELLENALDAGARRIRVQVEAGGKKLIQITDDGCGMVRDDAMLAFERHATSKIRDAEDLLNVATLGFRGEALPSIASVSRLRLETCAATSPPSGESFGTVIEVAGGKIIKVEEAGLPAGTSISVRDLFFNTPARKKFLKAESTELSHIASLVTHYALAHPDKHFELHSATNAMLVAAPVASRSERIYQVFGKETLDQLLPIAAAARLEHVGLPEPPPWRRDEDYVRPEPGEVRVTGFTSRPEIQKLNRNSIFVFVNGRLIRDRLIQHGLTEAYRNILPPTVFPVVLLFLEMPAGEVDVNVHPSKTEVRFRQQGFVHDFVRDSVRAALMKTRPVPQFTTEIHAQPTAAQALSPVITPHAIQAAVAEPGFLLEPVLSPPRNERFAFGDGIEITANAAVALGRAAETQGPSTCAPSHAFGR